MVMAVMKSPSLTVAHAMARTKMRAVRMDVAKIVVVANRAVTNNAAIIEAVKTVVAMKVAVEIAVEVRPALVTNVAAHRLPAANPEATVPVTRGARATMAQSQRVLVGIRML